MLRYCTHFCFVFALLDLRIGVLQTTGGGRVGGEGGRGGRGVLALCLFVYCTRPVGSGKPVECFERRVHGLRSEYFD